ncbi:hypothetical protein [Microbispora sp. NBC_01389]|uniref:hypothetical protein n=1 Tax=Microbispora sp. NBC_01389 TaxID=2903584 RepID=UPI0032460F99
MSYSICEKRKGGGHTCVTYLSSQDVSKLGKSSDLPMVIANGELGMCAAVLSMSNPAIAAGCGAVGSVVGIINGIVQNIQQDKINAAQSGSAAHGEGDGVAVITRTTTCRVTMNGNALCTPLVETVYQTQYAPL